MLGRVETRLRRIRRLFRRTEMVARWFRWERILSGRSPLPSESLHPGDYHRGLILVQIDGLGFNELEKALKGGEMPFMKKLLDAEHYALHPLYSGLPSSTPGVQGELFYGIKSAVPAFAFIDQETDTVHRMYEQYSAKTIEQQLLLRTEVPLLSGGSAYCNIYTGGASEPHFCAASMGWSDVISGIRPMVWLGVILLYLPLIIRTVLLVAFEFVLAVIDMMLGWFSGYDVQAEFKFVPSRVAISVLMRDMITIGARMDIARGLPIIHLNYLGYDEQAHRRGPRSAFAHLALKGIDDRIRSLWSAGHQSQGRHYDLWIYSDHGQESTLQYEKLTGNSLVDAVRAAVDSQLPDANIRVQSLHERIDQRRTNLFGGVLLQNIFPTPQPVNKALDTRSVAVVAMGPVGHIYLDSMTIESCSLPALAVHLVEQFQLPGVLYIDDDRVFARCANGLLSLPEDSVSLLGASHPALHQVKDDLIALVRHPKAGQLVLLGWVAGALPLSFPRENGAHAGIGPLETGAFALLPDEHGMEGDMPSVLRPLDLRRRALDLRQASAAKDTLQYHKQRKNRKPGTLRVMSYNVHSCLGMDGRIAPERIARIVSRYQPDVIALQELDVGRERTDGVDQVRLIAQALDLGHMFHPTVHVEGEEYGDAVLTHLPVVSCRTGVLPTLDYRRELEPRGVLWLTVMVDECQVQILNTHLGLSSAEQRVQVDELMSDRWLANPGCSGPTILCGDLNATPRSETLRRFGMTMAESQSLLPDSVRNNTFSGRAPYWCIDHVLVRDIKRVMGVQVANTELTRLASDHLPLIVDLELPMPG